MQRPAPLPKTHARPGALPSSNAAGRKTTADAGRVANPRIRAGRLVRDVMTEKVFALSPADDLATLYDLMDSRHVRHVPILEDGEIVGLVTRTELSRCALGKVDELPLSEERAMLRRRHIRDIMSTEPDTIEPHSPLREAAEMLLENKIGCVPVVEGLRLVGIITEADFVSDFLNRETD